MSVLGYAALALIVLVMLGLLYVDASARLLLARMADRADLPDGAIRSAAEGALGRGFQARLRCLKSVQPRLQDDALASARIILRIHALCWLALVLVVALWPVALLLPDA